MTLPPSLSELDPEADSEHELSRLTVLVGPLLVDVGLPPDQPIATLVNDVIELANDQLPVLTDIRDVEFENTEDAWTFARPGGSAIDPARSLSEVSVYDGDLLIVQRVDTPAVTPLYDDVEGSVGAGDLRLRWLREHRRMLIWFALAGAFATVVATVLLPRQPRWPAIPIAAIVSLAVGLALVLGACLLARQESTAARSPWIGAISLPLLFGGALFVVPGAQGAAALPMALGLCGFVALLVLLVSGRGRALYTAIIAVVLLGVPAALVELLINPNPRAIGAVLGTVGVLVVYLAPRVTIALSKLPIPRVPTAGEPLDDIETQGGTTVEGVNAIGKQVVPTEEGLAQRVHRANEYLTGIIVAAAVSAVVGCYLANDVNHGFFWQGVAFSIAVATALCLRGRSHHDLIQSATLIAGGVVIAVAMLAKIAAGVPAWQINAAVGLIVVTLLAVACGLVATRMEFSPVMRRWVEILEYFSIALVFPLACWIMGIYAFFREFRL